VQPQGQGEIPLVGKVDFTQEIQMIEELVQKDPGNPDAWSQLGDVFYRGQLYDKAVEAYTKALNLRPARTDVLIKLGNAHFDRGANEGAIEAYSKALSIDPKNADVLTDLGIAYRRAGNPNRAVEAFRKAAQMDANHLNSRYNLGVVLFHDVNDKEGAIRAWEDFLQVEPKGERAEQVKRMVETLRNMSSSQ
jgi:cytochrome c-type biogenesis protein CcmH/NrfG